MTRAVRLLGLAAILAAAAAVLAVAVGCGTFTRAVGVLREVGAPPSPDTAPVSEEAVAFATPAGETAGTVYRLAEAEPAPAPGVVLSHGAAEAGFRDARLVRLARALARAGFVVLAPDLAELRALRVDERSIARIEGGFAYLRSRADLVGENPVSLAGISFAGSFSLLAATRDGTRDAVAAVLAFGAYHDLEALVRYWLEAPPPESSTEGVYPIGSYGRWIALLNHLDALAPPEDRGVLRATLEGLIRGKGAPPAPASLSPRGASIHEAARAAGPLPPALAAELLDAARAQLGTVDVRGRLSAIRAPVFLLHAANDGLIPESHSLALRDEIEASAPDVEVRLLVSDAFRHVTIGAEGSSPGFFEVLPEISFLAAFFGAAGL